MKVKTSVTLSADIIALIDKNAEGEQNRSSFIEQAIRTYLEIIDRKNRDKADLQIINSAAEKLNKEALDVLNYQMEL